MGNYLLGSITMGYYIGLKHQIIGPFEISMNERIKTIAGVKKKTL